MKLVVSGYKNALFEQEHLLGSYFVENASVPYFCLCLHESKQHDDMTIKKYILLMDRLQDAISVNQDMDDDFSQPEVVYASEPKVKVEDLPF
jgi:hypothetical protein